MKAVKLLFFCLIFLIATASASEFCYYNVSVFAVSTNTYTDTATSSPNTVITQVRYFYSPVAITYLELKTDVYGSYPSLGFTLSKYDPNQNKCVNTGYAATAAGYAGYIQCEYSGSVRKDCGGFTMYIYKRSQLEVYIYATYNTNFTGNEVKYHYYITSAWPMDTNYCSVVRYDLQLARSLSSFPSGSLFNTMGICGYWGTEYRCYNIMCLATHSSANTIDAYTRYLVVYDLPKLNVSYDSVKNLISVDLYAKVAGYYRYADKNYSFAVNANYVNNIPYNSSYRQIDFYDNGHVKMYTFDLNNLECISQAVQAKYMYKLVDKAGNTIQEYKLIDTDYAVEYTTENGVVNADYLMTNVTVIPLFEPALSFDYQINTTDQIITITAENLYVYTVEVVAKFRRPLTNELTPWPFEYNFDGIMLPDKNTTAGNYAYGGTAYGETIFQLPAGEYNVTISSEVCALGICREDIRQFTLSLLDNNYYKKIYVEYNVFGSNLDINDTNKSTLNVIVLDQNGNYVNGLIVKLYDNDSVINTVITAEGGKAKFTGLELNHEYTIKVYYYNADTGVEILKATKTIVIRSLENTVYVTVYLSKEEKPDLTPTTPPPPGGGGGGEGGEEVAQNILAAVVGNYAFWGFLLLCVLSVAAASSAGERIGLIVFVGGLGVLTFVIPLLPTAIFMIVAIVAGILFTWKVMDKIMGTRGD